MIAPVLTPAQIRAIASRFPDSNVLVTGMRVEAWVEPGSVWVGGIDADFGIVLRADGTEDCA